MNRGSLGVLLILLSLSIIFTESSQRSSGNFIQFGHTSLAPSNAPYTPSCPCPAFNVTHSQFDIYTSKNATAAPPNLTFFSTINNTQTGNPVSDTAFKYSIPPGSVVSQSINYTLSVPRGPGPTTFLRFDWNGTLGQGTSARYLVYNASKTPFLLVQNVTKAGPPYPFNFTGGPPTSPTGGVPVSCDSTDECYDMTGLIGSKVILEFLFANSNSTGKGLGLQVANIEVASVGVTPTESSFHTMKLNSPTQVSHNATVTVTYNATATNTKHFWGQTVTTYYFPKSYSLTSISLNNSIPVSLSRPIVQGSCSTDSCSNSQLSALKNMQFIAINDTALGTATYPWFRGTVVISASGGSGEGFIQTTLGGIPTNFWGPGDTLQVRVNDTQGVNVTGSNIISILSPSTPVSNLTQTFSAPSKGIFLFNFTSVLPEAPLGSNWNVTSVFFNNFDYGIVFHLFRVEQVHVNQGSFLYSGDNARLLVSGTLSYGSNSTIKPANVAGNIFAVDNGVGPAPLSTPTITSGTNKGVYISNVTMLNGVFTSGESLIVTFTLVNPPSNGPVDVNATIDHEWASGQTHGASVKIPLTLGDQPFTLSASNSYVYSMNATLTDGGIRLVLTSLSRGNGVTVNMPAGMPQVTSVRQHSGLFKITLTSKNLATPSPCGSPTCTNSLESPTYAYVLVNPPVPGRLLASSPFTTISDGTFTASIASGGELGARKLVFFVLGQDPNGIVVRVQDKSTPESTLLQASIDNIPTATEGQSLILTLHLTSNSTVVNMNITVSLDIDGKGIVQSRSGIYIPHGTKMDVAFSFNAPSGLGVHSLTFFSPEYGAPLITGTLQVSALQSSLQVIIPAIIGLAAAIVILLFFQFRKKPQAVPEASAKDKPSGGKASKSNPGPPNSKSLT